MGTPQFSVYGKFRSWKLSLTILPLGEHCGLAASYIQSVTTGFISDHFSSLRAIVCRFGCWSQLFSFFFFLQRIQSILILMNIKAFKDVDAVLSGDWARKGVSLIYLTNSQCPNRYSVTVAGELACRRTGSLFPSVIPSGLRPVEFTEEPCVLLVIARALVLLVCVTA